MSDSEKIVLAEVFGRLAAHREATRLILEELRKVRDFNGGAVYQKFLQLDAEKLGLPEQLEHAFESESELIADALRDGVSY